jgi:hypothetical protein
MYSDCVLWSGTESTVSCIPLSAAGKCCDSSITQVITDIAKFACDTNVSDLTNYNYTCLANNCACSITSFFDLFNLVITKVCNLEAGTIAVGDLNWNCYATPASGITGITEVIQYLIDQTCITGKPSNLNPYCYTLPESYDINTVLEAIMEQTCTMFQLSGLNWACFDTPVSNSLQNVIQNILTTVCNITNLDLNWDCFHNSPTQNTINYSFQNIIDEMYYKLDFSNIVWGCVYDGSSSCTDSISIQFNRLISYMCSKFDMSTINWGCFTGTATNSIVAVINQLISELCNISLTWGCVNGGVPVSGLKNQLQAILDAINAQKIGYNTAHFSITGTTCSNRGLSLITPTWTATSLSAVTGGSRPSNSDYYLLDPFGNVRLNGQYVDILDTKTTETTNYGALGYTGFYLPILRIPAAIAPSGGTAATSGNTGVAPVGGSVLRSYGFVEAYVHYTSSATDIDFLANPRTIGGTTYNNVASVDTISSDTSSLGYFRQYKRIIPAQLIKCSDNNWYICVDKEYLPGGINYVSTTPSGYSTNWPSLIQSSAIRVYIGPFTYNLNN